MDWLVHIDNADSGCRLSALSAAGDETPHERPKESRIDCHSASVENSLATLAQVDSLLSPPLRALIYYTFVQLSSAELFFFSPWACRRDRCRSVLIPLIGKKLLPTCWACCNMVVESNYGDITWGMSGWGDRRVLAAQSMIAGRERDFPLDMRTVSRSLFGH